MKIEEVEGLKELFDGLKAKIDGAEVLLQKHKNDVGEARTIAGELKEIIGDKESFKKTLDLIKTKVDNTNIDKGSVNNQDRSQGVNNDTAKADISKAMTKEQKARADEMFKKLKPEDRVIIKADPDKRNEFFKAAMEAVPMTPESLFDDESANTEEDKYGFRKFFGIGNKEKNFVPGSRNVGASGFDRADPVNSTGESTPKRLIGGKIPRPATPVTQM